MLKSFAPILGRKPKVLILGSMPSQKSLERQQYYAHSQNSFWWVMAEILDFPINVSYSDKVKKLTQSGVAVWDVLSECYREGSLDSRIIRASEVANDIPALLEMNSSIEFIGFNGGAAKNIYKRHIGFDEKKYDFCQLPSTSPAYASITKKQKCEAWQQAVLPYIN